MLTYPRLPPLGLHLWAIADFLDADCACRGRRAVPPVAKDPIQMTTISILLLAAGASSRMKGRDKLLEVVDGQPLLSAMCRRATLTGLVTYVTLPGLAHPRADHIGAARPVEVPDASDGMAASIRRGVAALPVATDAVMILPADMPEITTDDLLSIAAKAPEHDGQILRAYTAEGKPGHPVLFPRRCFAALQGLQGDQGARPLLVHETVHPVPLPGNRALTDLDTPEDWARWRSTEQR